MGNRMFLAAALFGLIGCTDANPTADPRSTTTNAETAKLSWAAFECSVYAGMGSENLQEEERLIRLGYESGRRFWDGVRSGTITDAEAQKAPVGFASGGFEPNTDFSMGRIFAVAAAEARSLIVQGSKVGGTPVAEWFEPDLWAIRADNEYARRNCSLLR